MFFYTTWQLYEDIHTTEEGWMYKAEAEITSLFTHSPLMRNKHQVVHCIDILDTNVSISLGTVAQSCTMS